MISFLQFSQITGYFQQLLPPSQTPDGVAIQHNPLELLTHLGYYCPESRKWHLKPDAVQSIHRLREQQQVVQRHPSLHSDNQDLLSEELDLDLEEEEIDDDESLIDEEVSHATIRSSH